MAKRDGWIVIGDLRGGRNDTDPPLSLPDNQCVEALNVDWYQGTLANKRGGSTGVTDSGGTAFSSGIQTLFRHVPGADETAAEFWGVDGAATPIVKRMAAGTSFANVSLDDAISTKPQEVEAVTLNGKPVLAYDSTADRAHVYDTQLHAADQTHVTNTGQEVLRVGAADRLKLAQSVQAGSSGTLSAIDLILKSSAAIASGNIWITLETDNADTPSGTQVGGSAQSSFVAASLIPTTNLWWTFWFPSRPTLVSGTKYWIVLQGDEPFTAAVIHWQGKIAATGYANGRATEFTAAAWSATPTANGVYDFDFTTYLTSTGRIRRVGLPATVAAPTVADTGAGAYGAVLRYYRTRWLHLWDGKTIRRSEPSGIVGFTPSGGGTAARVTQPTVAGEGETHWEVERSPDNATWYRLLSHAVPIGITTADDTFTAAQTALQPVSDPAGFYGLLPSVKHLLTDGNRILGAGAWEPTGATSGGKNSRVWFTPVLGSADKGDDERVPNQTNQKNWVDLNENDGGGVTALMGPLNGVVLAGKYRQLHRLIPTGDVFAPYLPRKVSEWVGVVGGKAWCVGRDDAGQPCIYFLATQGPYRYGAGGLQYMGRDNETTWATLSLGATGVIAWVLYHPDKHQVWWHIAVSSGNDPSIRMVFDVLLGRVTEHNEVRGGWAKHTGDAPAARCGTLFANTLGASMSRDLKPYIGRASGTAIQKADTTDTSDNGTAFQAYVTPKPIRADAGSKVGIRPPTLVAKAVSVTNIALTLIRDYGLETPNASSVSLAPTGSETRVVRKFEAMLSGADVIQPQVGDAVAAATAWTLDELSFPIDRQEIR